MTQGMVNFIFMQCTLIISASNILLNYISQFSEETYCFSDDLCVFKQPRSVI